MNNQYYFNRDMLLKQNIHSIMTITHINQIVIHSSNKQAIDNKQNIIHYFLALLITTGQRPILTRAKNSISSFRLRKGQILGCKVTLRRTNLQNFLKLFINGVLPQVRDFKPISINGDGNNNISFGIPTYMAFPHLEDLYDMFESCSGFDINFMAKKNKNNNINLLLTHYGLPLSIKKEIKKD